MSVESKNDDGIVKFPRKSFKTSINIAGDGSFGNTFPGTNRFLNGSTNKCEYIDIGAVLDSSRLEDHDLTQEAKAILKARKSTIMNVTWHWPKILQYINNTTSKDGWSHFLISLEQKCLSFLQSVKLWHDITEMMLIVLKIWIWKTGNRKNVFLPESALL